MLNPIVVIRHSTSPLLGKCVRVLNQGVKRGSVISNMGAHDERLNDGTDVLNQGVLRNVDSGNHKYHFTKEEIGVHKMR